MRSTVLGWGRELPARVVLNEELGATLGVPASELEARTGVVRRHYAPDGEGPSHLARAASLRALEAAGLGPADVDLIIFATMTPDIGFPGSGCFLQHHLGCGTVGSLDVRAQCAGFLYALATADRFIRAGKAARVLVAAAEVHSSALDFSPRGQVATPYFGDGAAAVVVGAAEAPGVLTVVLHADAAGYERFWCEFPASRHLPARMDMDAFDAGRHFYALDADALHPQAERALGAVIDEALDRAGVGVDEVGLFALHYLDHRVARRAAAAARLPADRVLTTADAAGHIGAASLPLALADAVASGRVRTGDVVCAAAFGAGISWGAAVLRL